VRKKIDVQYLEVGMYVAELDRPWLGTPFLFQGFDIQAHEEIEELRRYCKFVYIDIPDVHVGPPERRPRAPALSIKETPVSTETIQGETGTVASSANAQTSTSAGPGTSANYSATANDTTPTDENSLTDNHHLAVGSSAGVSTGRDVSSSYQKDHSAIYTDKNDSAAGAPATTDRGVGSSNSLKPSSPVNVAPATRSPSFDAAWSSQIKSELTTETPDNTGASSFTSASLQNVDISQSNGTIMLKGTVPTEQMKRDLERRVQELSPGSMVNNQLSIAPSADLPANGSSAPRD